MAFQNVGKPRFYVDLMQYLRAIGELKYEETVDHTPYAYGPEGTHYLNDTSTAEENTNFWGLDPYITRHSSFSTYNTASTSKSFHFDNDPVGLEDTDSMKKLFSIWNMNNHINYFAILGHNLYSQPQITYDYTTGSGVTNIDMERLGIKFYLSVRSRDGSRELNVNNDLEWRTDGFENIIGADHHSAKNPFQGGLEIEASGSANGFSIWLAKDGVETSLLESDDIGFSTQEHPQNQYPHKIACSISAEHNDRQQSANGQHFDGPQKALFRSSDAHTNAISCGRYYDMAHSPNMSLTLERSFEGIDTKTTSGGSTLTNIRYTGVPDWGIYPAWTSHFGNPNHNIRRVGRRKWSLSFDMLADDAVMGAYEHITSQPYDSLGYHSFSDVPEDEGVDIVAGGTTFGYQNPLIEDNSFYSQILVKPLGGKLPFIFQPDSSNNNADQFAICTIPRKSIKFRQKSHKLYSLKLNIVESW